MSFALAWQLVYSVLGLCSISAAIRLYGTWARTGGRWKLGCAFALTCLTVDSSCGLVQTIAVQPHRWLLWALLAFWCLLVGLALRRTFQSFPDPKTSPRPPTETPTTEHDTV